MIGKPGGNLIRTYEWHIESLNSDVDQRFEVDDIHSLDGQVDISKYDIFWFYAKAFHPSLYHNVKNVRPDAKIICGPNILLDKPDIGPADDWDQWYTTQCSPDIHLDQVSFYSEHVKKFLRSDIRERAKCLDKCMKIDDSFYRPGEEKVYDCLLYSKKRRYDKKFEEFRNELISILEKDNISYCEFKSGTFGSYKREEYFAGLNKSKCTVNLSLDECPGILNYESMFFNVPVIGSRHNAPINSSDLFYVKDTDFMTDTYLERTDDAATKYANKIREFLRGEIPHTDHRNFIINHTSFERYNNSVNKLISDL